MIKPLTENKNFFDFSIWKSVSRKNTVFQELNRLQTLEGLLKVISQLSLHYRWDALYIFGSITRPGHFDQYSDIDIGVQGLDKYLHYRFLADLSGKLERDVDVVRLEDCCFSEAIKSRGIRWTKEN
ncbi:MAG: nucleotidyltransferase domain-containing protein [Desulfobacteraceae bacterium]|nr:nucleotidyltransferase domain-containing protein [Desulfobacteraceae bacterium]